MIINIGCDLVNIVRFKKSLQNKKFTDRIFHQTEIDYCKPKKDEASSLAARFAAKEAFAKALGSGIFAQGIGFSEIWIENAPNGKPTVRVSKKLETQLDSQGVTGWDVSLSHHVDYAMATVVMYSKGSNK